MQVATVTAFSTCSTEVDLKPAATNKKLIAIGAGTGVPMAIALLVAAVLLLRERRRNQSLTREKNQLTVEAQYNKREVARQRVCFQNGNQKSGVQEVSALPDPAELVSNSLRY